MLLIPHICCDEALVEIRLGADADPANGPARLTAAQHWCERIGLPRLLPRIERLTAQLSS